MHRLLLTAVALLFAGVNLHAQSGCTDQSACNYDPNAITNDGSCQFIIDCAGVCGGTFVDDLCGNCYDPNAEGQSFSQDFNYTGAPQTFTVPAGVTSVSIEAWGASGWSGSYPGGEGGYASGDLSVNPGDELYVYVGGQGTLSSGNMNPTGAGWNGGGNGQSNGGGSAGGGGGASDVRLILDADPVNLTSLQSRVIVAGGGGGATNNSNCFGGAGGGLTGQDGGGSNWTPGTGGSQVAGGSYGGALGQGGSGDATTTPWNGGGGGGYYGGGTSTEHAAGGGGSSYIGGVTNGSVAQGGRNGNGIVTISWSEPAIPECIEGCMDPTACNYDDTAQADDGSCIFPDGCTDETACNYDANALCDDGSCVTSGCMDGAACNYDPQAGCDNGSCIYVLDCNGTCGGTYIEDLCGNCYDPNMVLDPGTVQFDYTGSPQTFTVPEGVTSVSIEAWGASGWSGNFPGGQGGSATGDLAVNPGDELYVYVGGQGTVANGNYNPAGGGWNGGGNGQSNGSSNAVGGGGGASDVRLILDADPVNLASLQSRVIVAGGGGGATNNSNAYGGNGGGLTGQNGGGSGYTPGTGGSQNAGGNLGGALGQGGSGDGSMTPWNGGGGGGYYGGGTSPAHAGGGGGSSYIGGVTNGSVAQGGNNGNGYVIISWDGFTAPECIEGCTNPIACNYDDTADADDGSCILPDGCTDPTACNYDDTAQCDDGSCILPDGCTDQAACNYDPNAQCNDGSCQFVIDCAGVCGGTFVDDLCGNCYDPNAEGQSFSQDFNYTGAPQTFTVPAGVTSVSIEAWGASGWSGNFPGGQGGSATGDLAVNPGDELYVYVGGQGTLSSGNMNPTGAGWNGGGNGQSNGGGSAGGGGGASDVRLILDADPVNLTSLQSRVIVAGGGGGATNNSNCFGGAGGGLTGQDGGGSNWTPGTGGSQVAGGSYGGALGQGGSGDATTTPWNGGGGGGYYGGGTSTEHAAGGGGSSYIGGVTNGSVAQGGRNGNGIVTISWVESLIPECDPGCTDPEASNFDLEADADDGSCIYPGCTDETACNYDAQANEDDGSCILPDGCTDETACNYDDMALCNDGSCTYANPFEDCNGNCLNDYDNDGVCDEQEVFGCTYEDALNYDPAATADDGSCTYAATEIAGCMDEAACNYDANASVDSGACFFPPAHRHCDYTCINDTDGDGVCDELEVDGCTDPEALNFAAEATDDDGSCQHTCPGDLNGDFLVNSSDLLQFLGTFGQSCP